MLGYGRHFLRIVSLARFDINGDENLGSVNRTSVMLGSIVLCWISVFNCHLFNYFVVVDLR